MTQYLPLACYGKVPCWLEYLEANVSQPSSRALRDWVRQGRGQASRDTGEVEGPKFLETARRRFLFGPPGSADVVVGFISPSRDQAGRGNAFSTFTHLPRRYYGKHYNLLPLALSPVWEALEDAWATLFEAATRSHFDETVENTLIPAPVSVSEARGQYQAIQGDGTERVFRSDGTSLEALESNFPEVLSRIKKGGGNGIRLELPVSADLAEACHDVSFWLDLINQQYRMRRFEPSVFLGSRSEGEEPGLLLVFGSVAPEDYLPIMAGEEHAGDIVRPARGAVAEDAKEPSPSSGEEVTFGDLLSRRFHG